MTVLYICHGNKTIPQIIIVCQRDHQYRTIFSRYTLDVYAFAKILNAFSYYDSMYFLTLFHVFSLNVIIIAHSRLYKYRQSNWR